MLSDADFIEKSVIKATVKQKHGANQPVACSSKLKMW